MTIIFDEIKYAEGLLETGFSRSINYKDLAILAKYYRNLGDNDESIRANLLSFCLKYFPEYNDVIYGDKLDSAIKNSKKIKIKEFKDIIITDDELASIKETNDYKCEKILFVMLVIAKSNRLENNTSKDYYINYRFSSILSLAKVYVNKIDRDFIKHYLYKKGKIEAFSSDRNGKTIDNFKLLYGNVSSASAILVDDYSNIVDFYPNYCDECRKPMIRKYHQRRNLCDNCYRVYRNKDRHTK
jgi:hypothetical protein